jgi:hypothetical protein
MTLVSISPPVKQNLFHDCIMPLYAPNLCSGSWVYVIAREPPEVVIARGSYHSLSPVGYITQTSNLVDVGCVDATDPVVQVNSLPVGVVTRVE